MIGIDTNLVVRSLVTDDVEQSAAARTLFESLSPGDPAWISQIVLAETYWVLHRKYRVPSREIIAELARLVSASNVVVEQPDVVRAALDAATDGADFADALIAHAARKAGARTTLTFDAAAAKSLDGMELLPA